MALSTRVRIAVFLVALASLATAVGETMRYVETRRFNDAIAAERFDDAARYLGDRGAFAGAYGEMLDGDIDRARAAYGTIDETADPALRTAVLYNLGNSYLREAMDLDPESEKDLAQTLLELAKVAYRDALGIDETLWDARINLSYALRLQPDAVPSMPMEVPPDTGAVRTIISADTEEDLP